MAVQVNSCVVRLLSLERLTINMLTMTEELIANMLGVKREGVTEAAGKFQKLGVITYKRGHITIIDGAKLEALCYKCDAVVESEIERLGTYGS
ncbi:hypothetical protein GCM10009114_01060 [Aliiglaciecola litoralis]|uniref:HTH crp-type domain-containing protein n=1 Tax=Aliiglaciecola litoralis TaxID=582857 RepID=A0ABN1LBW2_9ALTE